VNPSETIIVPGPPTEPCNENARASILFKGTLGVVCGSKTLLLNPEGWLVIDGTEEGTEGWSEVSKMMHSPSPVSVHGGMLISIDEQVFHGLS